MLAVARLAIAADVAGDAAVLAGRGEVSSELSILYGPALNR